MLLAPLLHQPHRFASQDEHRASAQVLYVQQLGVEPWQWAQIALLHPAPLVHRHTEALTLKQGAQATNLGNVVVNIWRTQEDDMTFAANLKKKKKKIAECHRGEFSLFEI